MLNRLCVSVAVSALAFCGAFAKADDLADIRTSGKAFAQALHDGEKVGYVRGGSAHSSSA